MTEDDSAVGSVGVEAAKLLGALQDWARDYGAAYVDAATQKSGPVTARAQVAHGEDCRYCPICRAIRVLRDTSPEVKQHLASAAGSLAQAVGLYLSSPPVREDSPGTERIDLDDD